MAIDPNEIVESLFANSEFRTNPTTFKPSLSILLNNPDLYTMLSIENLIALTALPGFEAEDINQLAQCNAAKIMRGAELLEHTEQFCDAVLNNASLTTFKDFDAKLLQSLAKYAKSDAQFTKILHDLDTSATSTINFKEVLEEVILNDSSEPGFRRKGVTKEIFEKLRDPTTTTTPNQVAKELNINAITKLAARTDCTSDNFKLILAIAATKPENESTQIILEVLNNKAFTALINTLDPKELITLTPHIENAALLKQIAQKAIDQNDRNLLTAVTLNPNLDESTAALILDLRSTRPRNTEDPNRKALLDALPEKSLNNLATKATTTVQFKNILNAHNATADTADLIIQQANEQNTKASMNRRGIGNIFRGIGLAIRRNIVKPFMQKVFKVHVRDPNIMVESIADEVLKKFKPKDLNNESLRILLNSLNNAKKKNQARIQEVITEMGTKERTDQNNPKKNPSKMQLPSRHSATHIISLLEKLPYGTKDLQGKELIIASTADTTLSFPPQTDQDSIKQQALLFVEALKKMAPTTSTFPPLKLTASGFNQDTIQEIKNLLVNTTIPGIQLTIGGTDSQELTNFNKRNSQTEGLEALVMGYEHQIGEKKQLIAEQDKIITDQGTLLDTDKPLKTHETKLQEEEAALSGNPPTSPTTAEQQAEYELKLASKRTELADNQVKIAKVLVEQKQAELEKAKIEKEISDVKENKAKLETDNALREKNYSQAAYNLLLEQLKKIQDQLTRAHHDATLQTKYAELATKVATAKADLEAKDKEYQEKVQASDKSKADVRTKNDAVGSADRNLKTGQEKLKKAEQEFKEKSLAKSNANVNLAFAKKGVTPPPL